VDFDEALLTASFVTPVPGGVGPVTAAMMLKNTVSAAEKAAETQFSKRWKLSLLRLNLLEPIPL
jgi:methylenetetrahydrofolate dehydrogenase (NADP+) / methenyltetrahydrofolate cyclohydrolase / formyltetrahydrofolate synthetase